MEVRMPSIKDKEGIKQLWIKTFGDSKSFVDWYFDNRYNRAYSTCLEIDDKIASAMQGYPYNLRIRGRIVQASMLSGVSTDENYRGQGLMSKVFSYHMEQIRDTQIPLVFHTPANTPTFFSKGHFPVSLTRILTIDPIPKQKSENIYELKNIKDDYSNLSILYTKWSLPYSGIVARSLADFNLKMEDYGADDGKIAIIRNGDHIEAYGIFYELDQYMHVEEIAYDSPSSLTQLLKEIAKEGKEVRAKLPADSIVNIDGTKDLIKYQGVCGVASIQSFLKAIFPVLPCGFDDIRIEVTDHMLDNNNGVFYLDGSKARDQGHITIEVGRLCQLLFGFLTLDEMEKEKQVYVNDRDAFSKLNNLLVKLPCFIVDEY